MTFTDDDLKRLRENVASLENKWSTIVYADKDDLKALLARLYASERLLWALDPREGKIDKDFVRECRKAYLEASGKSE